MRNGPTYVYAEPDRATARLHLVGGAVKRDTIELGDVVLDDPHHEVDVARGEDGRHLVDVLPVHLLTTHHANRSDELVDLLGRCVLELTDEFTFPVHFRVTRFHDRGFHNHVHISFLGYLSRIEST